VETQPVDVRDREVLELVSALDAELAGSGYTEDQMFGYSPERLGRGGVHVVGVRIDGRLAGIGGVEITGVGVAELKRMYVVPQRRGSGAADAILAALVEHARRYGVGVLRLETGDQQQAALGFYRRHGFVEVPRFPPYVASETSICMQRELT
jgi:GNAT superfamily N-acetyltransferase